MAKRNWPCHPGLAPSPDRYVHVPHAHLRVNGKWAAVNTLFGSSKVPPQLRSYRRSIPTTQERHEGILAVGNRRYRRRSWVRLRSGLWPRSARAVLA